MWAREWAAAVVVVAVWGSVRASLNLYVDAEDVKQLLGVNSQLWYVNNGTVNHYALNYEIVVPPQLDALTFYWQALQGRTIPYTLSVSVANPEAVLQPVCNISDHGLVPTKLSSWTLRLTCTRKLTTEVDVTVTLQVPMNTSLADITTLTIHRKKVCLRENEAVHMEATGSGGHSTTVVYVTVAGLGVFLALVAALAALNHTHHNKMYNNAARRQGAAVSRTSSIPNNRRGGVAGEVAGLGKASHSSLSELRRSPQPTNTTTATTTTTTASPEPQYTDPRQSDLSARLAGLRAGREWVELREVQQEGTFGRVYRALYQPPDQPHPTPVTVKTVTDSASEGQRTVLLSEGLMLAGLTHDNLLGVLGAVVSPPEAPPYVILPASSQGNLKRFLQGCHTLVTREVVSVGVQVLQGLAYLHARLLLHKDVATRNCVVDGGLQVRLGDCALSRDLYPGDYHCLGDNHNRPIKWLALESLTHKIFSPASDVWSWGVLLWEVMTLGQQPYAEIDPFEMAAVLRKGVRLAQPINCPDELFKAMTFCWTTAPQERPTVDELTTYLTNFQQHLDRYV
ncbi:tyrosine-protein kinase Dnt-like isoform X2 [Portunus trituberculatus]|uniref:tyrosine-protein kinase Dnt-like isoform X2 n=1 Tax=Portunus trituberculatus TaxID=210409 RepID=UPI001E1D1901|nr:tyrosine-protein kinase Dnt-like isoform X2 [Portunus trituberculatus]